MTNYEQYAIGNPSQTRFRVIPYIINTGRFWRAFEIAQPGQRSSWHGDNIFSTWKSAYGFSLLAAGRDRYYAKIYGEDKRTWPDVIRGGFHRDYAPDADWEAVVRPPTRTGASLDPTRIFVY